MSTLGPFPNPFTFRSPRRAGTFRPTASPVGSNPTLTWGPDKKTMAARLFVGFNVCDVPVWKLSDLVEIVKEIRTRQVGSPNSSFLAQRGLYQDAPPPGERNCGLVEEDSAQVVIFAHWKLEQAYATFREHLLELAGEVARRLKQREVILELQKNGVTKEAMGVAA